MELLDTVQSVKGVGPARAADLGRVGISTIWDLLTYYPRRYDDFSQIEPISRLRPGNVTIQAEIKQIVGRYARRGLHITEAVASDSTGSVRLIWFNQPYRIHQIQPGKAYFVSGQFGLQANRLAIMNSACELVTSFPVSTARLVPVYREKKDINSAQLRKIIGTVFAAEPKIVDTLPSWLTRKYSLENLQAALKTVHFPENHDDLAAARRRLAFEEVFGLTLAAQLNKQENDQGDALAVAFDEALAAAFVQKLPFVLTDSQRKAVWQIYQDIAKPIPMNRLLEGDVGSGKTVVATMASLMAIQHGYQVALMAPTELLARQHAETVYNLLEPLGLSHQVCLLVGSLSASQKRNAQRTVANGTAKLIVGTHALISEKVDMHKLAIVVIDEQHRFGVQQRKRLQAKAGHAVHALQMTATPIPRSLALTVYGDLDISILSQKPKDRKPVVTELCSPNSRTGLYEKIDTKIQEGRQCFVVCQTIDSTDTKNQRSVHQTYEELRLGPFKHRRVGLLHGRMSAEEKSKVMSMFVRGRLDILVATTVVEVGVDVPNASVMLIENADRFGLAQLHQLRGRVGRGKYQGVCYLMMSDSSAPTPRLRAITSSNDGFKLAELDLALRGPGSIYGTLQHGVLDLRIAELTDTKLISQAQEAAKAFIARGDNLLDYKELAERITRLRAVTNLN